MRPFADAVLAYAQAGWSCIMPVPLAKAPPPEGFTGADGRDTDPVQLATWAGSHAASSVALRMPDGVIGIDVDEYVKAGVQKHGAGTLAAHITLWGELPATWSSTAREHPGLSRIYFYRVPVGRYATKLAGGDVEIIQRHHRYAVVWPSPHPDAGDIYRWYAPDGTVSDTPPKPSEFPELPEAWVAGLREGATEAGPAAADVASGQGLLDALVADTDRPACPDMLSAAGAATAELEKADAGSRHDTMTARVHHVVQLGAHGHPGAGTVLANLALWWENLTTGEDRADEFQRMLLTSARKAVTVVGPRPVGNDPCLFTGGLEIAAPAPSDDRPGAEIPTPIEPPEEIHPLELIGTHPFVTRAKLDQRLAEAVLERMYPVLRYGYDTGAWLLRGRTHWETRTELAEWAVSTVAVTMPRGDSAAPVGTDDRHQAELRTRFMTAAKSGAIAKKMRSVVATGSHPCALRVAALDSEPWLLWAGGVGWDLSASHEGPVAARIDPTTPHLRSAGVAPDVRPTPLWDAFTAAVWPDAELRAWALRVLSIAITGYSDKALPIMVGERDRGKTQVVVLLASVLGSYAHAADPRLLAGADNAHASIVYALKGRRLSFIDEGPRDGRLGQERLKQLTGGGDLTANEMNRNPITFTPTHTLVLTANDEPLLTDPAVRGRVRLIPCEGDPSEIRATRGAIGHTSGPAWRNEAPGVLAGMMRQAAAWLADQDSARTENAPEAYRFRAEEIAAEQDPVTPWLAEETEQHEAGTRSRELYEAFVDWARRGNTHSSRIPTETKWGKDLSRMGFPSRHRRDGFYRPLRIRPRGGWFAGDGFGPKSDGLVTGYPLSEQPITPITIPGIAGVDDSSVMGVMGVMGLHTPLVHAGAHDARTSRAHEAAIGQDPSPITPVTTDHNPAPAPTSANLPEAARISARLIEAKEAARAADLAANRTGEPAKPARRPRVDPAVRAAEKATAKQGQRDQAIATAAGPLVTLPALVTRDGTVREVTLADVPAIAEAFGWARELTVDVEHTGYPIGHADYALRTIQLGGEQAALVLDAGDAAHRDTAAALLTGASVLRAHSATADLVPLAFAGVIADLDDAWARMHDTAIQALLADPQSTGSDAEALKELSRDMLCEQATTSAANEARKELFAAGKWLTETKATTAPERSGWAQVASNCTTMVRYAASDVLDTAALPRALPPSPPAVLERERIAQHMTARVAHIGVRLDAERIDAKLPEHRAALAAAGDLLRGFGIDNPGSDQQVGARLIALGAPLPRTKTGRPSVAKGAIEPFQHADGPVGDLVRARLDYQHHETVLGLFLEPYAQLVHRGDGRARPTVYTLGADTGRMSCVRPNLQQVPRQGGIRACITADPGDLIVSADFAGVEVRVACALSGDPNLARMIADDVDLHWLIARQVYGPDATKEDRYNVKRGVFAFLYGSGIPGIARTLGITEAEAASMVDVLASFTPQLSAFTATLKRAVGRGTTQFPSYSGRVIHLDPKLPHKALNYCVQGSAREILVDSLVRWRQTKWGNRVLIPVHDEVLVFVPEEDAEEATRTLVECMEMTLHGVPIKAETSEPSFAWKDAS